MTLTREALADLLSEAAGTIRELREERDQLHDVRVQERDRADAAEVEVERLSRLLAERGVQHA